MRIENMRLEQAGEQVRQVATVVWEDSERAARDIYFATDQALAQDWEPEPNAFLTGCIVPAMRHGERRVKIDAPVAPELRNGLLLNLAFLRLWYGEPRRVVDIETCRMMHRHRPRPTPRTAVFLSGGVDSLAALRANHLDYPRGHPKLIRDGLIIHGFDIGGSEAQGQENAYFRRVREMLRLIAQEAQIELIPISTNIRHLDDDMMFWMYEFHGAALAAVAHALTHRLSCTFIGSSMGYFELEPWGSHPLLDGNYSSGDLAIQHDGLLLSRLDKVRLVAGWDTALAHLRVFTMNPTQGLNCGRCEKCLRTMLELLAVGRLCSAASFPARDVSPAEVLSIPIDVGFPEAWYQELIEPLAAGGRADLVEAIRTKLQEFQRQQRWAQEKDWKGYVKRFDRKFLRSALYQSYRATRRLVRSTITKPHLYAGATVGLSFGTELLGAVG